ncbi:hypothetical protein [Burkholderia sp. Ac-20353]|uniref:hypothetical protein n=1 Tax=Burkholderia sp. Ac-20353 TaxID=2703894 RepID=UPI00197B3E47|nr:hypothetical protein [Burkholderia sp. Ac-20353]MBN3788799.1 hypothetical protein [Burkholderia sp. Ac-20353]
MKAAKPSEDRIASGPDSSDKTLAFQTHMHNSGDIQAPGRIDPEQVKNDAASAGRTDKNERQGPILSLPLACLIRAVTRSRLR